AALGSLNGLIIAFGGVPPIIVTLGTLSIYRGLIFLYSGRKSTINASELPPGFRLISKGTPLGLPNLILFAIVVAASVYYFLRYSRTGRDISPAAADDSAGDASWEVGVGDCSEFPCAAQIYLAVGQFRPTGRN